MTKKTKTPEGRGKVCYEGKGKEGKEVLADLGGYGI